jgi:hypothetical protein
MLDRTRCCIVVALVASTAAACKTEGITPEQTGEQEQPCLPNGTCMPGLVCEDSFCVAPKVDSGGVGGAAGSSGSGGSNDASAGMGGGAGDDASAGTGGGGGAQPACAPDAGYSVESGLGGFGGFPQTITYWQLGGTSCPMPFRRVGDVNCTWHNGVCDNGVLLCTARCNNDCDCDLVSGEPGVNVCVPCGVGGACFPACAADGGGCETSSIVVAPAGTGVHSSCRAVFPSTEMPDAPAKACGWFTAGTPTFGPCQ